MTGVIQSGLVTPNHVATWVTPGVIADGGPVATGRVMISARSINFNTTNDQPIVFPQWITAFRLATIIVTNASISLTTAQGGFYPQAAKAGTAIVANTQAYSSLTATSVILNPTLAGSAGTTRFSAANLNSIGGLLAIWFSLTTAQGSLATGDVYFVCDNLS
jgi:hypothetical protein